jgi:hypothetical protein
MQFVEIRLKGHLDESRVSLLGEFTVTYTEQAETILTGVIKDQAALYGLIAKLRDLGISLITVNIQTTEQGLHDCGNRTD